jgi:hypothetical protein
VYGFTAMHMDFQNFNFKVPDSLTLLSAKFWVFLASSFIVLGLFFAVKREDFLKASIIVAAYIFIIFPLAQWPNIMGTDQFLHTGTAKLIGSGLSGQEVNYVNDVYLDYPVTATLQFLLKTLTGLDYVLEATILAASIKGVTVFLTYLVCSRVLDKKSSLLIVMLFLVADFRFNDYYQFAPQSLAFALFLLMIYSYVRSAYDRKFGVVMIATYVTMVMTHPYTSFFAMASLASLFGIRKVFRVRTQKLPEIKGALALFAVAFWIFWQIYPAVGGFSERSASTIDLLSNISRLQSMFDEARTAGRSAFDPILLDYQFAILAFTIVGGATGAFLTRKHVPRVFVALLFGMLILTVQLVYTSDPPRIITLDKVMYFGILPASILTVYLLTHLFRRVSFFHVIFGAALIAMVPLSFFTANQYTYMNSIKNWEVDSVTFAVNHTEINTVKTAMMDTVTSKIYEYYSYDNGIFKPFIKGYYIHRNVDAPEYVTNVQPDFVLMSMREKVDWYYNQGIAPQTWDSIEESSFIDSGKYNRIYDNSYSHEYLRN